MTVRELMAELEKLEDKDAQIRAILDDGRKVDLDVYFKKTTRFTAGGCRLPDCYTMCGQY